MRLILAALFSFCCLSGSSQEGKKHSGECDRILREAQKLSDVNNYEAAIKKLTAVTILCPDSSKSVNSRLLKIYTDINAAKENEKRQVAVAVHERKIAERQAYLAQLSAMSSTITLLNKENPTVAFQLACLAYESNSSKENCKILKELVSDTSNVFYKFKLNQSAEDLSYSSSQKELFIANSMNVIVYGSDGELHKSIPLERNFPRLIAISPGCKKTVTISSDSTSKITLYNLEDSSRQHKDIGSRLADYVKWTRDGKFIIVSYKEEFDLYDTLLHLVYTYKNSKIKAFDIGPDLEYFAISDGDNILLYDTTAGHHIPDTIQEPNVHGIAISPTTQKIYTTYNFNNSIKVWDNDSLPIILNGHNGKITSLSFSSESNNMLTSDETGVSILWSDKGELLKTLRTNSKAHFKSIISDDGSVAVTKSDNEINFWDIENNSLGSIGMIYQNYLYNHNLSIEDISGSSLLLKTFDNHFFIADGNSIKPIQLKDSGTVFEVSFCGDTKHLVLRYLNSLVLLLSETGASRVLASTKNGYLNYSVNSRGNILIWLNDSFSFFKNNGDFVSKISTGQSIYHACITPDGKHALHFGYKSINLVNLATGKSRFIATNDFTDNNESINKLLYAESGCSILAIYNKKAFLMDTAMCILKAYFFKDFIKGAKFSLTEDSIFFISSAGVDIRLTVQGLKNITKISGFSIRDRLKYNVPGVLETIFKNKNWRDFDECFGYYFERYLKGANEDDLYIIKKLVARENIFFKKNLHYYLPLESRISTYLDRHSQAKTLKNKWLEEISYNVYLKLQKEKIELDSHVKIIQNGNKFRYIWK